MVELLGGIYEHNIEDIRNKVTLLASSGVPNVWAQIDIADNTFVANEAATDIKGLAKIIEEYPDVSFEAHLMVLKPEKYVKPLADAGFKRIIAHVECEDPREFLEECAYESVETGLAIDGPTEIEQIEPFIEELDVVLVMTIEAGASGQAMLPETVEKIKILREHYPDLPIEVDGGVNTQTIKIVVDAGATRAVSTSYLFANTKHIARAFQELQDASS
jgi:ribulose-phosphate 3-epimerase